MKERFQIKLLFFSVRKSSNEVLEPEGRVLRNSFDGLKVTKYMPPGQTKNIKRTLEKKVVSIESLQRRQCYRPHL